MRQLRFNPVPAHIRGAVAKKRRDAGLSREAAAEAIGVSIYAYHNAMVGQGVRAGTLELFVAWAKDGA